MSKEHVYQDYDKISDWFDTHRDKSLMEQKYLDLILKNLPKAGSILDLGCGTGEPIARFFIEKGMFVTGVDGSQKMLAYCRQRFPCEEWIQADMRGLNLKKRFNAIIAWHSLFHLDQASQRAMFEVFSTHLLSGGILAFTSGDEAGEIWSDNGGLQLYHASLSTKEYEQLLAAYSFKVLTHQVRDPECGDATIWIAKLLHP